MLTDAGLDVDMRIGSRRGTKRWLEWVSAVLTPDFAPLFRCYIFQCSRDPALPQLAFAHQIHIHSAGGFAAFGDSPDYK